MMLASVLSSLFRLRDSDAIQHGRSKPAGVVFFPCLTASLTLRSADSATGFKEPDYSKFKVEDGQYSLEFWSGVGGLDNTVKDFEKAYPNIKIHVNNVGGGPAEYEKLRTAERAGSGAQDVVQCGA